MGTVLLPGTAYLELALHAGNYVGCPTVTELVLETPLVLSEHGATQLQVTVGELDESGHRTVTVHSRPEGVDDGMFSETAWTCHATGVLAPDSDGGSDPDPDTVGALTGAWPPDRAAEVEIDEIYGGLADMGLDYGPMFQGLRGVWRNGNEVFCEVRLPEDHAGDAGSFGLHPALLDSVLHAATARHSVADSDSGGGVRLPFSWNEVSVGAAGASSLRAHLSVDDDGAISLTAVDDTGTFVVSAGSLSTRAISPQQLQAARDPRDDSLFAVEWTPLSTSAITEAEASTRSEWVVLGPTGSPLAQALIEAGARVSAYEDLKALGDAVERGEGMPDAVLFDLDDRSSGDAEGMFLGEPGLVHSVACGALGLLQAWLSDERFESSRLCLLSREAVQAGEDDRVLGLAASAVWGLVRSAESENPDRFVLVDVDRLHTDGQGGNGLVGEGPAAGAELDGLLSLALSSGETQLAIRAGGLLVGRLVRAVVGGNRGEPVGDDDRGEDRADGVSLEDCAEGSVLITGAPRGLGGLVARHLVGDRGVRSLVLASRRGPDAPGAAELQRELEGMDARVEIVACDVSDKDALRGLLEHVPGEFPLRGVVHTAGVLDDGVIGSLTEDRMRHVFAPKVNAAWYLHELTEGLELSMFALFSSAAAAMGSPGQANYAAANSFLDALAAHRRARGLVGTSIAWGYWDRESEMTSGLGEGDLARMARQGVLPISVEQGLGLFDTALELQAPAPVAMRVDWRAARAQARAGLLPTLMSGLVRTPTRRVGDSGSLARRLANVLQEEREVFLRGVVRNEVALVLGHSSAAAVDPDRAFKDLGFDSLAAVELRNRLNKLTGLRLPSTVIFDHPNTTVLALHIQGQLDRDDVNASLSLDREFDNLQRTLSRAVVDHAERVRLTARVETLLSVLEDEPNGEQPAAAGEEDLQSATDDELFELIDKELGAP